MLEIKKKEKVAVPYVVNGETVATFYIAPLSPFEMQKLVKQCRTVEWAAPSRREPKQRFIEPDLFALAFERMNRTIVGWEGVTVDGKEIECTQESKRLLYENAIDVVNYVMSEADKLMEVEHELREQETKN